MDLGSNSFHLIVAEVRDGQLVVMDRIKEMVQLGAGLDRDHQLDAPSKQRALDCLERFGQRLRDLPGDQVMVVGTNTLRQLRDGGTFVEQAQERLGHPIEIISGREEARLIYSGVAHSMTDTDERRLVIDIGGGSTEVIIGQHFEPRQRESLFMGCVSMSRAHFADGKITQQNMRRAEIEALLELQSIERPFRRLGWDLATGSSGTIRAIADVIALQGWAQNMITSGAIRKMRSLLIASESIERLPVTEMPIERLQVLPGGFAILSACFESLGIKRMSISDGALREGLLYNLLGRMGKKDGRSASVSALRRRFAVDRAQATRVRGTARKFWRQVAPAWQLEKAQFSLLLDWASTLHEIGLSLAHNQYHKHGAYIIGNADMAGFSRQEQQLLATLVRGHRRKFPEADFKLLPKHRLENAIKLCMILRLAVLLHRSRSDNLLPEIALIAGERTLNLRFPKGWLNSHTLTAADLEHEAEYIRSADWRLFFE